MKKITILFLFVFTVTVFAQQSTERPKWIDAPQKYGVSEYAKGWIYEHTMSQKCASESLARSRAKQRLQFEIASNIANEISAAIGSKDCSLFAESGIDDPVTLLQRALCSSIETKVPGHETLEWYVEQGKEKGKAYYIAHVLVRFKLKDILGVLDKVDPDKIIKDVIKNEEVDENAISDQARKEFMNTFKDSMKDQKKSKTDAAN